MAENNIATTLNGDDKDDNRQTRNGRKQGQQRASPSASGIQAASPRRMNRDPLDEIGDLSLKLDEPVEQDALPDLMAVRGAELVQSERDTDRQKGDKLLQASDRLRQRQGQGGIGAGGPGMAGQAAGMVQQAAMGATGQQQQPGQQEAQQRQQQTDQAMEQRPALGTPDYAEWARNTFSDPVMLEQELRINREEQSRRQRAEEAARAHEARMAGLEQQGQYTDAVRQMNDPSTGRPDATQFSPERRAIAGTDQFDYSGFNRPPEPEPEPPETMSRSEAASRAARSPDISDKRAQQLSGMDQEPALDQANRLQGMLPQQGEYTQRANAIMTSEDLTDKQRAQQMGQLVREFQDQRRQAQASPEQLRRQQMEERMQTYRQKAADMGIRPGREFQAFVMQQEQQRQQPEGGDIANQMQRVEQAVQSGQLDPDVGKTVLDSLQSRHEMEQQQNEPTVVEPGQAIVRNGEEVYRNESRDTERYRLGPNEQLVDESGTTIASGPEEAQGLARGQTDYFKRQLDTVDHQMLMTKDDQEQKLKELEQRRQDILNEWKKQAGIGQQPQQAPADGQASPQQTEGEGDQQSRVPQSIDQNTPTSSLVPGRVYRDPYGRRVRWTGERFEVVGSGGEQANRQETRQGAHRRALSSPSTMGQ